MRTALCLSGYFSSKVLQGAGDEDTAIRGFRYIRRKIIDDNTDVFIHTWDESNYELIKKLYDPKQIELEKPKSFEKELKEFDVEWFGQSPGIYSGNTIFRDLSMNFSRKRSVELIDDNYDRVIMARFDLGQRGKEWFQNTMQPTLVSRMSLIRVAFIVVFGINSIMVFVNNGCMVDTKS